MRLKYYGIILSLMLVFFSEHIGFCENYTPENFVKEFYIWYTKNWNNHYLIYDNTLYKYVDKCIVKKLQINRKKNLPGYDYFTASQDNFETWPETLKVYDAITINESLFAIPVDLAPDAPNESIALLVFLEKENEKFHIIKVKNIDRDF